MAKKKRAASKARASWKGTLRVGLVTIPVQAFNAHLSEAGSVAFHQLHAECHSRIRYEKTCPVHGAISNQEIVSGYEYSKGRYVEIEPDELDSLRTEQERSLSIDAFVEPDQLDPIYLDGRMYYLAPDGDPSREPYAVLLQAMQRKQRYAIGQVVFSGKEQVALVRPYHDALHMALLNYEAEIKDPQAVVAELPEVGAANRHVRLAEQLIDGLSDDDFDFGRYRDIYLEKVRALIEAKVEGREIVAPPAEELPDVVNLMDALRQSIRKTHSGKTHSGKATQARPRSKSARTRRTRRRRAS
jgi:DNA end-binding protein Ku